MGAGGRRRRRAPAPTADLSTARKVDTESFLERGSGGACQRAGRECVIKGGVRYVLSP